jgi:hypothetical protein
MHAVFGRLLLLLLLACDWAVDPYQGTSPLSAPLASTESFCHSLAHQQATRQACLPAPQGGHCTLSPFADTPPLPPAEAALEPPAPALSRVYVFMSLRR